MDERHGHFDNHRIRADLRSFVLALRVVQRLARLALPALVLLLRGIAVAGRFCV